MASASRKSKTIVSQTVLKADICVPQKSVNMSLLGMEDNIFRDDDNIEVMLQKKKKNFSYGGNVHFKTFLSLPAFLESSSEIFSQNVQCIIN